MAGDEVGGNNIMEWNVNLMPVIETTCRHHAAQPDQGWDQWIMRLYTDGRGLHLASSSGTPCRCAKPPLHSSGISRDNMTQLVIHSNR